MTNDPGHSSDQLFSHHDASACAIAANDLDHSRNEPEKSSIDVLSPRLLLETSPSLQSKNALYLNFEAAVFRDEGDPLRFSYPADNPLTAEFEEQMIGLVREYKGDGEYLSVHHPDEQRALDDAPDCTALMAMAGAGGNIGEILFG